MRTATHTHTYTCTHPSTRTSAHTRVQHTLVPTSPSKAAPHGSTSWPSRSSQSAISCSSGKPWKVATLRNTVICVRRTAGGTVQRRSPPQAPHAPRRWLLVTAWQRTHARSWAGGWKGGGAWKCARARAHVWTGHGMAVQTCQILCRWARKERVMDAIMP